MTSSISLSKPISHRFDIFSQGVAYYDDTEENLGMRGPRSESSVDIEAGKDGSFHVAYGIPGRRTDCVLLTTSLCFTDKKRSECSMCSLRQVRSNDSTVTTISAASFSSCDKVLIIFERYENMTSSDALSPRKQASGSSILFSRRRAGCTT